MSRPLGAKNKFKAVPTACKRASHDLTAPGSVMVKTQCLECHRESTRRNREKKAGAAQ